MKTLQLTGCLLLLMSNMALAQIRLEGTTVNLSNREYQPIDGFIWLKSGQYLKGQVSFKTKVTETYAKDPKTGEPTGKPSYSYSMDGYNINGISYQGSDIFMWGSFEETYVNRFLNYDNKGRIQPFKKPSENFQKGYIIDGKGEKLEGYIAVRTPVPNGYVLYCKTLDSLVYVYYQQPDEFYQRYNLKNVVQFIDGSQAEHYPTIYSFANADKMEGSPATVVFGEGNEKKGLVDLQSKVWGYGMNAYQLAVFKEDKNGVLLQSLSPSLGSDATEVIVNEKGEDVIYLALGGAFYPKEKLLAKVMSNKKDESLKFYPGYAVFKDNSKITGKVALTDNKPRGFFFIDENNKIKVYYGNKKLSYFAQTVNGKETRYLRVKERFPEWKHYDQFVSYVRNPYPTHPKEGLNKFLATVGEVVTDELIEAAANQSIREGKSVTKTINDAVDMDTGIEFNSTPDDGGVYWEEFIILRGGASPEVVYKKNMDAFSSRVITGCDNFTTIEKKQINRLGDIDNLDETVQFLNQHNCLK